MAQIQFAVWTCLIFTTATLFADEQIHVSVCNMAQLHKGEIERAEGQAGMIFRRMGIEVLWGKCGDATNAKDAERASWYVIRVRNNGLSEGEGASSLVRMGRAFVSAEHTGYLADVYYLGVQAIADKGQIEEDALLGYVMAHELGHLLLGPGHVPDGIMRTAWELRDLKAIMQGRLKFNPEERVRIQRKLRDPARRTGPIDSVTLDKSPGRLLF